MTAMPEGSRRVGSMIVVRACKVALVAAIALFFTCVALGNMTDYDSNWQFVQHVLSMDTTFPNSTLHWRAVTNSTLQHAAYWLIIGMQAATAALLLLGTLSLFVAIGKAEFARARALAVAGLTVGLLLYMVGFVTIGGEWFAMWQSATWNGQQKAFELIAMIGAVLLVLLLPRRPGRGSSFVPWPEHGARTTSCQITLRVMRLPTARSARGRPLGDHLCRKFGRVRFPAQAPTTRLALRILGGQTPSPGSASR
jgi:predicted small integral membrane protein